MAENVPTDRELEALKILWQYGPSTVREIWDHLTTREAELAYTTVLSLMQTMEQKGLVGHKQAGRAYTYVAKVRRARTFRRLASRFLEKVFDNAMDEYLIRALESRRPSFEELSELEKMIAQAKERAARTKQTEDGR